MEEQDSGKILPATFERTIWKQTGRRREEVVAGPQYGVDVSVVRLPDGRMLASASDPASLIPGLGLAESAWLTVHLTANDLATTGHGPLYAQFVLNLPVSVTDAEFEEYWGYIHHYCAEIGVAITGGHTGKVYGQESTFAGGVTMSLVADRVLLSSGCRPGKRILVTKGCALSACAILAKIFPETVKTQAGEEAWKETCDSFWKTSVLEEAVAAFGTGRVIAMHDVTEGGVLGAVGEMCRAAGCGAVVEEEALPVSDAVQRIARHFGFDPTRSLGSGALLMVCDPGDEEIVIRELSGKGIPVYGIGHTIEKPGEVVLRNRTTGTSAGIEGGRKDPYWGAYLRAVENGWK